MRRYSLSTCLATALTLVVSLVAVGGAQAGVVNDSNNGNTYGVTLAPNAVLPGSVSPASSNVTCLTPPPARAGVLPDTGLCYHGGQVIHKTETFGIVWNLFADGEPHSDYAAPFVQQFLRDVADGSGTMSSPFAITSQYAGTNGPALNASLYGGGYTDADTTDVPWGCTPTGWHDYSQATNGFTLGIVPNDACVTDAQIRTELGNMITAKGLTRVDGGYTPLFVFMTPPGVETCLDSTGTVCSVNSDTHAQNAASNVTAQFCSYHAQLNIGGTDYNYVVQPWSAGTESPGSGCDEPDSTAPPTTGGVDPHQLATDMGARLVNPLSQAMIAAIVNPSFDGWYANDGAEINDNGCVGLSLGLDKVSVGGGSYDLQREFNNAGVMVDNAFAYPCAPSVDLEPNFVVPSPIDAGDVVTFDGANSPSTLIVPNPTGFSWDFGDGAAATGGSAVHSYAHGGTYTVTLKVTDRGGYTATASHQVVVLGPPAPTTPPAAPAASLPTAKPGKSSTTNPALSVRVTLVPQGLKGILRSGVALNVTTNQSANGILTLSIPRTAAKRAHISAGRGSSVVIGRGTVSGIHSGSNHLHVHLPKATAAKLKRLGHVTLTFRLTLVAQGGHRITVDAAGHY
jgi:hypothetical protein